MRPGSNSVEIHPQLTHKGHPVDGALVGSGSLWPPKCPGTSPETESARRWSFIGVISPKREIKIFKNKSDFGGFQSPTMRGKKNSETLPDFYSWFSLCSHW
jgi:hypothetical protein